MVPAISPAFVALVVLFVVFGLLQALYVYLLRNRTGEERPASAERAYGDDRTEGTVSPAADEARSEDHARLTDEHRPEGDVGPGEVRCPNCRTGNEARYEFCRVCLSELPA